jgi:arylsulfatase A-like enzyme
MSVWLGHLLGSGAAAFVALFLAGPPVASAAKGNVLLLIADDFGMDVTGFYPSPTRQATTRPAPPTPNLAALARAGILFKRMWATPWCSPTRAAMLTGQYGFRTGIGRPKTQGLPQLGLDEVTLPEVFRAKALDYVLAHIGKWHLSTGVDDPSLHGWPHFAGPEPTLGRVNNYYRWNKVVNGVTTLSTRYITSELVDDALTVITDARDANRPYFIWLAFTAPHNPFHLPLRELHSYDDLPATGGTSRDYSDVMVESLDTEIGRLLAGVDLASTTVIFVGDNGTQQGVVRAPYESLKAKGAMYQAGVHVPLVVAGQAVKGANREVKSLANAVDLFPTVLELAGIDPTTAVPHGVKMDGVTLVPYPENRTHPGGRLWAFAEQFSLAYDGDWQRGIRDFQYVLIERYDGTREFYDLDSDPLQKVDLLKGVLSFSVRKRLTRWTARWRP